MKSSLKNMVLCLLLITLGAGTAVGVVYLLTQEPIAATRVAKTMGALALVIEDFDNDPSQDTVSVVLDGIPVMVYRGTKDGVVTGYAVRTATKLGFSGMISMMVGFRPSGEIHHIEVLEHAETPGLGSKIADAGNPLLVSFVGNSPSDLKMSVRNDGGDIDAITASTITSRAYVDAVQRAYTAFRTVALGEEPPVEESPIETVLGRYDAVSRSVSGEAEGTPTVVSAVERDGATIGYAVEAESTGYKGVVRLMVGVLPDGTINDIAVLEQSETPSFGGVIINPENPLRMSLKGRKAAEFPFELKDVDGVSGSTVTTRAYVEAVNRALRAWNSGEF